ncbi:MAG: Gfo/Idh/MocA family oxidoreductase [Clostridia bacterium]|nr:Gfo/Idh/MocA family oxidoreductase [Clostridia bacterium]
MKKTKAGVVGIGFIGPAHIEALRRLGYVDVVALASSNQQAADRNAERLCVPKGYGDWRELVADEEVETVHICTPNDSHYAIAKAALLAGKHVICEKPLSMNAAEAKELVELARETGLVNGVSFNQRYYPLIHQVKAMIQAGELGRILAVSGGYIQDWLQKETDYSWRLEPEKSGNTRVVADVGSHWMDAMEFMTGLRISRLCADFATFYPVRKKPRGKVLSFATEMEGMEYDEIPISTEDYASVLFHLEGGAHGSFTVNQSAAGCKNRHMFEIYGTKAGVRIDIERPNELWIGYKDKRNEIIIKDPALIYPYAADISGYPCGHAEGYPDTIKQVFARIYRHIREGVKEDYPTFEDGYRAMLLCDRIAESAAEEKWVKV